MATDQKQEVLQNYVHALLARQQALDLLETLRQQINDVWGVMRRLLEIPGQAGQAVRAARAAQAAQAQSTYRALEKRREECMATLYQAERRANAALQVILAGNRTSATRRNSGFPLLRRGRTLKRLISRPSRRRFKGSLVERN